jgi:hypothetical protein
MKTLKTLLVSLILTMGLSISQADAQKPDYDRKGFKW